MVLVQRRRYATAEEESAAADTAAATPAEAAAATAAAAAGKDGREGKSKTSSGSAYGPAAAADTAAAAAAAAAAGSISLLSGCKTLCLSFGMGAAAGLLLLLVLFSGVYLLAEIRGSFYSPFKKPFSFRELRQQKSNHLPSPSVQPANVVAKDVTVKGLPALLLESKREQVFSDATPSRMHGQVGVTETGVPLWHPQPLPGYQTPKDLELAFTGYCFNTALSDSLSLDREVPSFDSAACAKRREAFNKTYPFEAAAAAAAAAAAPAADGDEEDVLDPRASVVIVFHNESLSVLLRSVHSVLNRTSPLLLREVVLVNDYSNPTTHPWLFKELETYVALALPKTRLLTLKQRRGLMGARAAGAAIARGSVLVFLDSHVEVLPFWLEPLLQRIRESPRTAALPRVASIEAETFEVVNGGIDTLAFNWSLGHMHRDEEIKAREENKNKEEGEPIESPIMPGGIFAISREWWNTLGGYDEGLRLYAGEEFELSFKVWMCGGKLEVLTCSKVAHIFRSDKHWKGN
ncbi:hypothetical protein Esti_001121 [Eimeria stiedai]